MNSLIMSLLWVEAVYLFLVMFVFLLVALAFNDNNTPRSHILGMYGGVGVVPLVVASVSTFINRRMFWRRHLVLRDAVLALFVIGLGVGFALSPVRSLLFFPLHRYF